MRGHAQHNWAICCCNLSSLSLCSHVIVSWSWGDRCETGERAPNPSSLHTRSHTNRGCLPCQLSLFVFTTAVTAPKNRTFKVFVGAKLTLMLTRQVEEAFSPLPFLGSTLILYSQLLRSVSELNKAAYQQLELFLLQRLMTSNTPFLHCHVTPYPSLVATAFFTILDLVHNWTADSACWPRSNLGLRTSEFDMFQNPSCLIPSGNAPPACVSLIVSLDIEERRIQL